MKKIDFDKLELIGSNMTLLYVEDNEDVMSATLETIKEFFKTIYPAKDGEEALNIFRTHEIDIVISDINIPKLDGLQLTSLIKKERKDTFIIMLSAHEEPSYLISSINTGVDGYLIKPLDIEKFADIMLNIGEKRESKPFSRDFSSLAKEIQKGIYKYVILLDISNFSLINKRHGKIFGDLVLDVISKRLNLLENDTYKLIKIDSDKFIFLTKEENKNKIKDYVDFIKINFIENLLNIDNIIIEIEFNAGAAKITNDMQELINAEFALQHAKTYSLNKELCFYDNKNESIMKEKENIIWLDLTKILIRDNCIYPYFQPILNISTGKIEKYEVLARAIHAKEAIPPIFFIPAAEKLGLITEITKNIIIKSFEYFSGSDNKFSINLSDLDFKEKYLCDFLKENLIKYNINPNNVTFEILENITIDENSDIIEQINSLKDGGFGIAIDDFGADNSNFSRFLDIDCDIIKIDRIFIKNIDKNEKHKIIVKTIVNLAKMLNIKTVAEYVENKEILETIKECGVDYAQGYLIGKPEAKIL